MLTISVTSLPTISLAYIKRGSAGSIVGDILVMLATFGRGDIRLSYGPCWLRHSLSFRGLIEIPWGTEVEVRLFSISLQRRSLHFLLGRLLLLRIAVVVRQKVVISLSDTGFSCHRFFALILKLKVFFSETWSLA